MPTTSADETPFEAATTTMGSRIQTAREAKGLTVAALSEKLGVDHDEIEAWETDEQEPRSNRVQMLAGMLNVSIMWLITGDSNGSDNIEQAHSRPIAINDALGEIAQLKETLSAALEKLDSLEARLQSAD